ncbi:cysteine hydrolase [Paenibacillus cellulositrophicus]|uniref:cysteine hydrolase family protein n=1 Tax=Paenibacillus cellulositrophicus TaxID=562959 RepID=UPI00203EB436|nr:isochorismatase family cysteine hydrolase [Paenibacillus cellulositrophicus]MCM2998511.1 cysteine hydrolase [Paenibacillus cellulositrophicus]
MNYISPNWNTSVLITIDTQNDFTLPNAPAQIKGTIEVLPKMRSLLGKYREKGLPIVHVIRLYKEDGSNVDICRKELVEEGAKIVAPNSDGAELVSEIRPLNYNSLDADKLLNGEFQSIGENEWVMYKSRWGAFYKTDLEGFLKERNIDTIVFTGCNFPNCPRTSIYEASERDFRVVMVADSMSQVYDKGIQEMKNIGVYVCISNDVMSSLK